MAVSIFAVPGLPLTLAAVAALWFSQRGKGAGGSPALGPSRPWGWALAGLSILLGVGAAFPGKEIIHETPPLAWGAWGVCLTTVFASSTAHRRRYQSWWRAVVFGVALSYFMLVVTLVVVATIMHTAL
jgi:hypothetical protein